jgi:hypothetical protein
MEYKITKTAQKKYQSSYPDGFKSTILEVTKDTLTLTKPEGTIDIWLGKITNLEEFEDLLIIHTSEFTVMLSQADYDNREKFDQFVETLWELVSRVKNFD